MSRRSASFLFLVLVVAVTARCGDEPAVEPLPAFPVETMEPHVQAQFAEATAAVEAAPDDATGYASLGMLYHAYGFHTMAEACYERAVILAPDEARWRALRARTSMALGRWEEAAEAFEAILRADPGDVVTMLHKADADRRAGRLDEAERGYRRVLAARPDLARAHHGLGQVLHLRGRNDEAIAEAREALAAAAGQYGAAAYLLGQALRDAGDRSAALEMFQQAEAQRDVEPPLDDPLVEAVAALRRGAIDDLHEGIALLQAGRAAEALPLLERAVELQPDLAEARSQLGAALLLLGRDGDAEVALERALELDGDFVDALYNLGLLAHRRDRFDEAVRRFERAVEVRPDHFDALLGLGTDLPALGRRSEAIDSLRRALAVRADDPRVHKRLAAVLAETGAHGEAIGVLRRGAAELPDDQSIADCLAWLLATCPDPALRDGAEALALSSRVNDRTGGRIPRAMATLAAALAATGRFDEALEQADRAAAAARRGNDQDLVAQIARQREYYARREPYLE